MNVCLKKENTSRQTGRFSEKIKYARNAEKKSCLETKNNVYLAEKKADKENKKLQTNKKIYIANDSKNNKRAFTKKEQKKGFAQGAEKERLLMERKNVKSA